MICQLRQQTEVVVVLIQFPVEDQHVCRFYFNSCLLSSVKRTLCAWTTQDVNRDHITVLISLILPSIKISNGDADAFPLQMALLMCGMWDWCADSSSCVWLSRMPIGLEFYGTISGCIDRTIHWTDLWFWQGRQSYCELRHPHLSPNLAPSDG